MSDEPIVTMLGEWFTPILDLLVRPLFHLGDQPISLMTFVKLLVFFALLIWVSRIARRILARRVLPRARIEPAMAESVANISYYILVGLGAVVGLQVAGINLSALTVLFGAIGVGVGFGLQTIASNFISGLIILFEQPIRIGDRIQVGELLGRVVRIKGRATEVMTNDGIYVIVPNSEFISQQVVNWSQGEERVRIHVPVGVSYGSDVPTVEQALLEAAAAVDAILEEPPPKVWFIGFGDSSLDFELLGWTSELLQNRGEFISQVNFAIHQALHRHGVEIPFPQRDLHLKSPLPIQVATRP